MPMTCTVADVEARWREMDADESDVAAVLVADALSKLRVRRANLATLIADADAAAVAVGATEAEILAAADWARLVKDAIAAAIIRVLSNPDRLRSSTIGADGSISIGYATQGNVVQQARLTLTEADLAEIDRMIAATTGSGRVVSLGLSTWMTEPPVETNPLPTP